MVDKELLFKPRTPEREVDVPGLGVFRVRGLTRAEIKAIAEGNDAGKDMEAYTLSLCLVDPHVTEDEARRWLEVAQFGEVEKLTEVVNEISGIGKYAKDAAKEAYKSVRPKRGS
jgi:hypothetical protein